MSWKRITYYSKYDLASFNNLEKAEEILINFDETKEYNINDIIELYQIKLYIDNEVYLPKWTNEKIEAYKCICKKIWSVIICFWNEINSSNLSDVFKELESWTVQESFWELISKLSVYKRISKDTFSILISSSKQNVRAILYCEKIVTFYGSELRESLLSYKKTAELILSQYVEKHDREWKNLHFPKCLSLKDKEDIISRYLDDKDANLNYVRLILNIKKQEQLDISDRTRLKAKKLEEKLNNEIFDLNSRVHVGVKISFSEDQLEPILESEEDYIHVYSYSTKYIFQLDDPVYYLSHFKKLFKYLDEQGCISMVSKDSDFDTIEKIFMKSRNEYHTGFEFTKKENLSLGQLFLYDNILSDVKKNNVENIVQLFIKEYIKETFNLIGFRFNLPTVGTNYSEKIRVLLAEFDAFLRQYKLFFEDGRIDYELLQMSSSTYSFSQIPSFATRKYCYSKSDYFATPFYLLFSDQSHLCYVDPFKDSDYNCFFDLLLSEDVLFENYKDYQVQGINFLIEEGYLQVDKAGILKFKDNNKIFIIKQLYKNEVLSYWHYSQSCRNIIDEMISKDILYFEDTLFNKKECDYFNYYLNKKDFTNGLDLRNSFTHGTNPNSENELKNLYYILLRIIVLAILKVNDDQLLRIKGDLIENN